VSQKTFSEFITDKTTLEKLKNSGFKHIFPIQEQTFNFVQEGRDVLASDRTGSGKTLAYTLPVLEKFHKAGYNPRNTNTPRFLILCPTRYTLFYLVNSLFK
jgi:ATP-dependent RNA helicase DDX21